jgi:hypothetical protein
MPFHESVIDAVDRVLSWDLPDEALPDAVSAEAGHLGALDPEQLTEVDHD